mgnify:CR=1 FL=1
MTVNVYLDVYFGFNFLMDVAVLYITGEIIKNSKSIIRTVVAALLGSFYATALLIANRHGILIYILTYIVVAQLMILIAFGYSNLKDNLTKLSGMYFSVLVLNGAINLLGINTKMCSVIFATAIMCVVAKKIIRKIRKNIRISTTVKMVNISYKAQNVKVKALVDTGNSLYEPFTKKPVSIIEKKEIGKWNFSDMKFIYIPFNSIGEKGGLLKAVIADNMEVDKRIVEKPIVGIFDGKLSRNGRYNMILHPDIINRENEYDSKLF